MQVYEYYLLGSSVKVLNRKYKCYIDRINELYNTLVNNIELYNRGGMDKFEFLVSYVIIYMSALTCLDCLVHDDVKEVTDKIIYAGFFEEFYNIAYTTTR